MGVSLSWIAIEGKSSEALHSQLGLSETGEQGGVLDFPMVGLTLPSGWYLLVAKGCDHKMLSDRVLGNLSSEASVIGCAVEEHVMFSSAMLWREGGRIWSIRHRGGDYGIMDLVADGQPPSSFDQLRAEFFSKQQSEGGESADVDLIFDIPLELAKSFVGFKHDEKTPDVEDDGFRALKVELGGFLAEATKPWWKIW